MTSVGDLVSAARRHGERSTRAFYRATPTGSLVAGTALSVAAGLALGVAFPVAAGVLTVGELLDPIGSTAALDSYVAFGLFAVGVAAGRGLGALVWMLTLAPADLRTGGSQVAHLVGSTLAFPVWTFLAFVVLSLLVDVVAVLAYVLVLLLLLVGVTSVSSTGIRTLDPTRKVSLIDTLTTGGVAAAAVLGVRLYTGRIGEAEMTAWTIAYVYAHLALTLVTTVPTVGVGAYRDQLVGDDAGGSGDATGEAGESPTDPDRLAERAAAVRGRAPADYEVHVDFEGRLDADPDEADREELDDWLNAYEFNLGVREALGDDPGSTPTEAGGGTAPGDPEALTARVAALLHPAEFDDAEDAHTANARLRIATEAGNGRLPEVAVERYGAEFDDREPKTGAVAGLVEDVATDILADAVEQTLKDGVD